jgi:hypothetical protein
MGALITNLDLRPALQNVRRVGAAFVSHALTDSFCRRLQQEVQSGPFTPLPEQMGPVHTQAELFVVAEDATSWPAIGQLRDEFVSFVRKQDSAVRGLDRWWPNEISVQRYRQGAIGVSPHLDSKRFSFLVAVFTTEGSAPFALCLDRAGTVLEAWDAIPGSLVLLRGPDLGGINDGRPFHMVGGPASGTRFSVTFRMNSRKATSSQ